nr:hypothetical protein BaRGS_017654 [Batillaria attramentaria]
MSAEIVQLRLTVAALSARLEQPPQPAETMPESETSACDWCDQAGHSENDLSSQEGVPPAQETTTANDDDDRMGVTPGTSGQADPAEEVGLDWTHPQEASIQHHTPSPDMEPAGEKEERPASQQLES